LIDHLMTFPNALSRDKFFVVPLGCERAWYSDQRVPGRIVFTSSADRGLFNLLQIYSKIKKAVPYAELRIFYHYSYSDVEKMEPTSNNPPHLRELGQRARYDKEMVKKLEHLGVSRIGSISRDRMKQELSEASVFAYPCQPVLFSEGFSLSTAEAMSSYTVPIISDADCLGSIYENSGAIVIKDIANNLEQFTDEVIKSLIDKNYADEIIEKCLKWTNEYTWKKSAEKLEEVIKNGIKSK